MSRDPKALEALTHLVIFRRELVEALLDDVVTIEVFDKCHHMKAECKDDRMDLILVSSKTDEGRLELSNLAPSG